MMKRSPRTVPPAPRVARGVAALELALVLPILLTTVFGITEFGRAMYQYDALTKSARAAARYLAVYNAADAGVRARAVNVAVCGLPDCTGADPVAPGLSAANVRVADPTSDPSLSGVQTGQGTMDLVRVTIGAPGTPYRFVSWVTLVVPDLDFGPVTAVMPQSFF